MMSLFIVLIFINYLLSLSLINGGKLCQNTRNYNNDKVKSKGEGNWRGKGRERGKGGESGKGKGIV